MKKPKFVITKRSDGQFMFNMIATNGEIIMTSEGYHNRKDCLDTIAVIMGTATDAIIKDTTK